MTTAAGMVPDLLLESGSSQRFSADLALMCPPMCPGRSWCLTVGWSVEDQRPDRDKTRTPATTPPIVLRPPLTDLLVLTSARPPAGVKVCLTRCNLC